MYPEVVVRQKVLNSLIYILLSLLMLALSVGVMLGVRDMPSAIFGFFGVVVFGISTLYLVAKVIMNTPLLVVDERGICDSSNASAVGLLPWWQVEYVGALSVPGMNQVMVRVRDWPTLLESLNPVKRRLVSMNKSFSDGKVLINVRGTSKADLDELVAQIRQWHQAYLSGQFQSDAPGSTGGVQGPLR